VLHDSSVKGVLDWLQQWVLLSLLRGESTPFLLQSHKSMLYYIAGIIIGYLVVTHISKEARLTGLSTLGNQRLYTQGSL
jgi:hypothetical protein